MPKGALGKPVDGVDLAVISPETGEECPPAEFDAEGRLLNAGAAIGEIVNRSGRGSFEGYYQRDGRRAGAAAPRLVLDGRPRLRRRGRLLLLRRPDRGLAAGRLGELRRRTGRGDHLAPSRTWPWRRSTRSPTPPRARATRSWWRSRRCRAPPSTPTAFAAWLDRATRPRPEVAAPLRPGLALAPPDGHGQGDQGGPARGGLGLRRPGLVATARHARTSGSTLLTDDDRADLAAGLAENGRPPVGDPTSYDPHLGQAGRRSSSTTASTPVRSPTRRSPGSSAGGRQPAPLLLAPHVHRRHAELAAARGRRAPRSRRRRRRRPGRRAERSQRRVVDVRGAACARRPGPR